MKREAYASIFDDMEWGMKFPEKVFLIALVAIFSTASPVLAAKYSNLKKNGYSTGKLTKNSAGIDGWIVMKGNDRRFCRMKTGMAIVNSKTMIAFTSSSRKITIDRKAFESRSGQSAADLYPRWSDVKNGTMDAKHVGRCTKLR